MAKEWQQFNCYKILGIPPTASVQEIHSAFKKASLKSHPDLGGSHDAQVKVNLAYDVLSDPISRQAHDVHWRVFDSVSEYSSSQRHGTPSSARSTTATRQSNSTYQPYQKAKNYYSPPRKKPLSSLQERIAQQVEKEKSKIWAELDGRKISYEKKFVTVASNQRQEIVIKLFIVVGLTLGGIYISSWLFWGAIYFGFTLSSALLAGIQIENRHFSLFASQAEIGKFAKDFAEGSCKKDIDNLSRYSSILASITDLLLRSSSFDDSEEQVARRLTAAFFLMGYVPYSYDRESRILIFNVGEEKVVVRFRHRSGIATNITFVEKLVEKMQMRGTSRGFLFCSPGLSGNAATYANSHSIKWYTLETMNQWIEQVFSSSYSGSSGNILSHLDNLSSFLSSISLAITATTYRKTYRKYRRW